MSFFFDQGGESSGKKGKAQVPLETAKKLGCAVCPLKKGGAFHPDMPPWGSEKPLVYFLGEAPGETEDKANRPFIGKSGQLLQSVIPEEFEDLYRLNNCVRSRPPANRTPTELELACCRRSIEEDIKKTQPKVIVAVGTTALNWLFDGDKTQEINKWRGKFFPVNIAGYHTWGYCMYHPSYILRNQRTSKSGTTYKSDLDYLFEADAKRIFQHVHRLNPVVPVTEPLQGVVWSEGLKSDSELEKVLAWLEKLVEEPIIAIDYETTHLRPFYPDAKILTVAVGTDKKTYAFPIDYPNAWNTRQVTILKEAFKEFLLASGYKIAHNTKFELEWTGHFFGVALLYDTKWEDTQAQAYVLDERRGTHNLDILVRTHFGFWLKDLSPMDKQNMIAQPLNKILPYNGMDTKWTFALFHKQEKLIEQQPKLAKVYANLIQIMIMLTHVQLRGILFNPKACDSLRVQYETELHKTEKAIQDLEEAKQYKQIFNQPFNPSSPNHVIQLFRDVLKVGNRLETSSGKMSTDESTLSKLTEFPIARAILNYRNYAKKISTYIEPMPGYVMPDGRIRTVYNPYETSTGRLCVAKGTMIEIMRNYSKQPLGVPVEDVKPGDYAYTYNDQQQVVLRKVTWAGKTGTKKVMRLHWIGDGHRTKGYLDVTCNHPIGLINGDFIRADLLEVGDRILSLTRTIKCGRSFFYQTGLKTIVSDQRFVYEQFFGEIPQDYDIHHKDHNSLNNIPENLEVLSNADHARHHAKIHWSNPENVAAMLETRKRKIESGEIIIPSGKDHCNWKEYNHYQLLRLIAKSFGDITKLEIDYATFLRKCEYLGINYKHCVMRFSKHGIYISKAKMLHMAREFGPTRTSRELRIDYTKLTLMLRTFGYISPRSTGTVPTKFELLRALSKARGRVGNLKGRGFSDLYKVKKYAELFDIDLKVVKKRYTQDGKYISSTCPNNHKIVKIEWLEELVDVYDMGVEDTHNFIANQLVVANSSDSPNLQNFPSKTGKEPRSVFCAPKDHILVCCDYGQIEARLIGAASQDRNFCAALWDNYDVHMEWAKKIAETYPKVIGGAKFLDDKAALKKFRSKVKNLWVFPAFYGAGVSSISAGIGVPQDLVEELFEEFWDQFSGVKKWQRWVLKRFNEQGYVETLFGRRRHAPMTANAAINAVIQGSASDICVLSMVELNKAGLQVVLNVHDEIGIYVPENQFEDQIDLIVREMTKPKLDWLNIPISVEVKVGQDWFNMEEIETFTSTDFYRVSNKLLDFTKIYDL